MRSRERKKWYCIQPIAALVGADLAPKLGSTIKLILLVRFQAKGTQDQEVLPPTLHLPCGGMGEEKKYLPSLCSLTPTAAVRAGPETRRMGRLALPLTSCSSWKSRHTRATFLRGVQVSWACGCENRRAAPTFSLKRHGIARIREICPPSHIPCRL